MEGCTGTEEFEGRVVECSGELGRVLGHQGSVHHWDPSDIQRVDDGISRRKDQKFNCMAKEPMYQSFSTTQNLRDKG